MATLQSKMSHGCKYWYIVESRRVNGKPRPVVIAYLGSTQALVERLQSAGTGDFTLKSYAHGAIAALLNLALQLQIPQQINAHIHSPRSYMAKKPIRNNLTAGMTLLLGAIGRVCTMTSKRGWWSWARTTSCEYLLKCSLSRIDSQHFWDLMDALPLKAIPDIEGAILHRAFKLFNLQADTLLLDTTNFFTFIHTTNYRCTIAQRAKNKQKRNDLRQVGLALVVTRGDYIPLFHLTYRGNTSDCKTFASIITQVKTRMVDLGLDVAKQTIVFDRGNNSKENLALLASLKLFYVGALTPAHHHDLIEKAEGNYQEVYLKPGEEEEEEKPLFVYREKRMVWGSERTVLVFVSEELKNGQMRGIKQWIDKKKRRLEIIKQSLASPRCKKRPAARVKTTIETLLRDAPFGKTFFLWSTKQTPSRGAITLKYAVDQTAIDDVAEELGYRIIMTNRHDWSCADIINAYHGQAFVENAFKDLKNPFHLAVRPQYHWTDQKICVHYFICVLGYLLTTLLYREARMKISFRHSIDAMLEMLENIRLATLCRAGKDANKKLQIQYQLEEMDKEERELFEAMNLLDFHTKSLRIHGLSVYDERIT